MNISNILDEVLGAGQQLSRNSNGPLTGGNLEETLGNLLGGPSSSGGGIANMLGGLLSGNRSNRSPAPGIGGMLGNLLGDPSSRKKLAGGAAATGILAMILGGRNGNRGLSASITKMGSLAAIGTLAYKAYRHWQNGAQTAQAQAAPAPLRPSAERGGEETERNSRLVLKAMIAAANADHQIDPGEREAILQQIASSDPEARQWLEQIVDNPPSVGDIAAAIGSDTALAAEVYLASRIVCGDLDRKEIVYLDHLQEALGMDDLLAQQLEKQAGF